MKTEDSRREEFEKIFSATPFEFDMSRFPNACAWAGNYRIYFVQCAWCGWEAAMELKGDK